MTQSKKVLLKNWFDNPWLLAIGTILLVIIVFYTYYFIVHAALDKGYPVEEIIKYGPESLAQKLYFDSLIETLKMIFNRLIN